jgi:thiamine-phosphate pyrophosphorylase
MVKEMRNKHYYYFCKTLNEKIKSNILKFRKLNKISIIFYNLKPELNQIILSEISKFCKRHNISLYIYNNYLLATKIKANGIYLDSKKRDFKHLSAIKLKFLGSAHNQKEYYEKLKQKCSLIMLSPLFFNNKYSKNKILNPTKFSLIINSWKTEVGALGGITKKNLNNLNNLKCQNVGVASLIEKPPCNLIQGG